MVQREQHQGNKMTITFYRHETYGKSLKFTEKNVLLKNYHNNLSEMKLFAKEEWAKFSIKTC